MEVCLESDAHVFPHFAGLVAQSTLLSLDLEMTGVELPSQRTQMWFDEGEAYSRVRDAATRYAAFQVGVCLFEPCGQDAWNARPFNFLVFNDGDTTLSASSVRFLLQHGVDFQRWLAVGMPSHTDASRRSLQQTIFPTSAAMVSTDGDGEEYVLTTAELEWVRATGEAIAHWYEAADEGSSMEPSGVGAASRVALLALHESLARSGMCIDVEPALDVRSGAHHRQRTTVCRVGPDAFARNASRTQQHKDAALLRASGFRKYWEVLVASGLPVVLHHGFADALFLANQNVAPLPPTVSAFCALFHKTFATVFDTKLLARVLPTAGDAVREGGGSLEELFNVLQSLAPSPLGETMRFPLGFSFGSGGARGAAHTAAYDAFMTGAVWLRLQQRYGPAAVDEWRNRLSIYGSVYHLRVDRELPNPLSHVTAIVGYAVEEPSQRVWVMHSIRVLVHRVLDPPDDGAPGDDGAASMRRDLRAMRLFGGRVGCEVVLVFDRHVSCDRALEVCGQLKLVGMAANDEAMHIVRFVPFLEWKQHLPPLGAKRARVAKEQS